MAADDASLRASLLRSSITLHVIAHRLVTNGQNVASAMVSTLMCPMSLRSELHMTQAFLSHPVLYCDSTYISLDHGAFSGRISDGTHDGTRCDYLAARAGPMR
jgi:hypothetical protein